MAESVKESWGYACPNCGSDESIDVVAMLWVRLLPDAESCNTDSRDQSWDWDRSSLAECICGYSNPLDAFDVQP